MISNLENEIFTPKYFQEKNHLINGDNVRKDWPIGMKILFRPKGWCGGEPLKGTVTGHIYACVLIVESGNSKFFVSIFRCTPYEQTQEKP